MIRIIPFLLLGIPNTLCSQLCLQSRNPTVVIFAWKGGCFNHFGTIKNDTITFNFLSYSSHVKDSVLKYLQEPAAVTTIFMAQPSMYIDSLDFRQCTGLQEIILSGNDADYLDSSQCTFLDCPFLKKTSVSAVYLNYNNDEHDPEYDYRHHFRSFMHYKRPKVKVKFLRWDRYYDLLWNDD